MAPSKLAASMALHIHIRIYDAHVLCAGLPIEDEYLMPDLSIQVSLSFYMCARVYTYIHTHIHEYLMPDLSIQVNLSF